jgi:hypothetical protein
MDITQYTGRLKQLADALRDVGQPVCETIQVLNMLRGLSTKYRHAVSAITTKEPPHTFLSARSYLLLEENYDKEQDKSTTKHALLATSGSRTTAAASDAGSTANSGSSGGGNSGSAPPPAPTNHQLHLTSRLTAPTSSATVGAVVGAVTKPGASPLLSLLRAGHRVINHGPA